MYSTKLLNSFAGLQTFHTIPQIQEWCEKCLDVIEEIKDQVENEVDYIDSRLTDFEFDLLRFCSENEVAVD